MNGIKCLKRAKIKARPAGLRIDSAENVSWPGIFGTVTRKKRFSINNLYQQEHNNERLSILDFMLWSCSLNNSHRLFKVFIYLKIDPVLILTE